MKGPVLLCVGLGGAAETSTQFSPGGGKDLF